MQTKRTSDDSQRDPKRDAVHHCPFAWSVSGPKKKRGLIFSPSEGRIPRIPVHQHNSRDAVYIGHNARTLQSALGDCADIRLSTASFRPNPCPGQGDHVRRVHEQAELHLSSRERRPSRHIERERQGEGWHGRGFDGPADQGGRNLGGVKRRRAGPHEF